MLLPSYNLSHRDQFLLVDLGSTITRGHIKYQVGPTVNTKTYIFTYFYWKYLVLFTMVPRNRNTYAVTAFFPQVRRMRKTTVVPGALQ